MQNSITTLKNTSYDFSTLLSVQSLTTVSDLNEYSCIFFYKLGNTARSHGLEIDFMKPVNNGAKHCFLPEY